MIGENNVHNGQIKPRTKSDDDSETIEKSVTARLVDVNFGQDNREDQVDERAAEKGVEPETRHFGKTLSADLG